MNIHVKNILQFHSSTCTIYILLFYFCFGTYIVQYMVYALGICFIFEIKSV